MKRFAAFSLLLVVSVVGLLGAGRMHSGNDSTTRPDCDERGGAGHRGKIWVEKATSTTNDLATICLRDAAGDQTWIPLAAVVATVTPINIASVTDATCDVSNTLTWSGVVAGEPVAVGLTSASGLSINAYASATDTVLLNVCNSTGADQNPSSLDFTFERRPR